MKTINLFLFLIMLCVTVSGQHNVKPLRIGLIADIQYADKDNEKTRFYRSSLSKLEKAIGKLNTEQLMFTVVLGDLVDEGPKDLEPVMQRLRLLNAPFYNVLGNHDYPKEYTKDFYLQFDMPNEYYVVAKDSWKFIFLNTNELSSYAVKGGSKLEKEYLNLTRTQEQKDRMNVQPWNGGIGATQIRWLEKELKSAEKDNKNVLIFTHHPVFPENGLEVLNNRELVKILMQYNSVKAVLSGHHHAGNFAEYEGIPFITIEGMIETADETAFGYMEISSNSLQIYGEGRMSSRKITFD